MTMQQQIDGTDERPMICSDSPPTLFPRLVVHSSVHYHYASCHSHLIFMCDRHHKWKEGNYNKHCILIITEIAMYTSVLLELRDSDWMLLSEHLYIALTAPSINPICLKFKYSRCSQCSQNKMDACGSVFVMPFPTLCLRDSWCHASARMARRMYVRGWCLFCYCQIALFVNMKQELVP